jgi:hypothetical protein
MFEETVIVLFIISFILALRASRRLMEKPSIKDVKKSLDKHRVIFRGHSSSK